MPYGNGGEQNQGKKDPQNGLLKRRDISVSEESGKQGDGAEYASRERNIEVILFF
jgi:hypothetical protein